MFLSMGNRLHLDLVTFSIWLDASFIFWVTKDIKQLSQLITVLMKTKQFEALILFKPVKYALITSHDHSLMLFLGVSINQ